MFTKQHLKAMCCSIVLSYRIMFKVFLHEERSRKEKKTSTLNSMEESSGQRFDAEPITQIKCCSCRLRRRHPAPDMFTTARDRWPRFFHSSLRMLLLFHAGPRAGKRSKKIKIYGEPSTDSMRCSLSWPSEGWPCTPPWKVRQRSSQECCDQSHT